MKNFFVALLVVSLVAFVSAFDDDIDSDPSDILGSDDSGIFGDFMKPFSSFGKLGQEITKTFKPPAGGHGEAHFSSTAHEEKIVNGKKVEDDTKSDKVDNVDGVVVDEEHKSN